jgi:glycosyltransferase involved in cell wall biosynthesis
LKPDEIVIADAASTDKTAEIIASYQRLHPEIKLINAPGNRSVGRNAAIAAAKHDIIAVADVGCRLAPNWLEEITKPFHDKSVQTVAGMFVADPQTDFERISAQLMLSENDKIDLATWLPSSRSIAFTKHAWEKAGRYPEYAEFGNAQVARKCGGEDTLFDINLKKAGFDFADGLKAVAFWRPRPTFIEFFKQYHMYAVGDGIRLVDYQRFRNLTIKYAGVAIGLLLGFIAWPIAVLILLVFGYKVMQRVMGPWRKSRSLKAFFLMPALVINYDVAQIFGFWEGYQHRSKLPKEARQAL